jgi:hypothetical protein
MRIRLQAASAKVAIQSTSLVPRWRVLRAIPTVFVNPQRSHAVVYIPVLFRSSVVPHFRHRPGVSETTSG